MGCVECLWGMHQKYHLHYVRDIKDAIKYKNPNNDYKLYTSTLCTILWDLHIYYVIPGWVDALVTKKRWDSRITSLIGRLEKNRDCKH